MLNKTSFVTILQTTVFNQTDWDTAADNLAIAIDNYYKSGVVETDVTGTVTPPFPATTYTSNGIGKGSPVTTTLASLKAQCKIAFQQTDWSLVGPIIANEINNLIISSTLSTVVAPGTPPPILQTLVGTGASTAVSTNSSDVITLGVNLSNIFKQNDTIWDIIVSDIVDEIDDFIKKPVFSTKDNGIIPINSWDGTGSGSITS